MRAPPLGPINVTILHKLFDPFKNGFICLRGQKISTYLNSHRKREKSKTLMKQNMF